jgi:hypothetical protein
VESVNDKEIIPLNHRLYLEFSIQELESRLETDPFLINNLFSVGFDSAGNVLLCSCNNIQDCSELTCGCNSGWSDTCACDEITSCPNLGCGCNYEYK